MGTDGDPDRDQGSLDLAPFNDEEWTREEGPRLVGVDASTDLAGYHAAFRRLEDLWAGTVRRARALDPELLHERVAGEWSFSQTLRHLAFATESWVGRAMLGQRAPWHPLSLPWEQVRDTTGVPDDRTARPPLEEVLALRADRQALVHRALDALTPAQLDGTCTVADGPGWPPAGETLPVRECLDTVINEEWWHRRFAERDLAVLTERPVDRPTHGEDL